MRLSPLFLGISFALLGQTHGGVVVNTNFSLSLAGPNYSFRVLQDEAGTDPTDIQAALAGQTLTPVLWSVDEGADYYLVPNGAIFSSATIALGLFQPLLVTVHPSTVNVGFGDFYLGINTGQGFSTPSQPRRDVFGWVHLVNNSQTGLSMVSNAMSYGGQGIIVGTTTVVVPEPATVALFLFGSCFALVVRRTSARAAR
jgi:hypothetical protein